MEMKINVIGMEIKYEELNMETSDFKKPVSIKSNLNIPPAADFRSFPFRKMKINTALKEMVYEMIRPILSGSMALSISSASTALVSLKAADHIRSNEGIPASVLPDPL